MTVAQCRLDGQSVTQFLAAGAPRAYSGWQASRVAEVVEVVQMAMFHLARRPRAAGAQAERKCEL